VIATQSDIKMLAPRRAHTHLPREKIERFTVNDWHLED
jgi:hypothetical protein